MTTQCSVRWRCNCNESLLPVLTMMLLILKCSLCSRTLYRPQGPDDLQVLDGFGMSLFLEHLLQGLDSLTGSPPCHKDSVISVHDNQVLDVQYRHKALAAHDDLYCACPVRRHCP